MASIDTECSPSMLAGCSEAQTSPCNGIPWQGGLQIQTAPILDIFLFLERLIVVFNPEPRHDSLRGRPSNIDPIEGVGCSV